MAADQIPDAAPRQQQLRLVVALPHTRLREAIAAALVSSGTASVVGRAADLADTIAVTRASRPDAVVLGSGLFLGDIGGDLRRLMAVIPGVRAIVVGTETSAAYCAAITAAGAADYVALEGGTDGVVSAVIRSLPQLSDSPS